MRILIASDAWAPQVNGVVRTLEATITELDRRGHDVTLATPAGARSMACPMYPEIRLALRPRAVVAQAFAAGPVDAVHIVTEGPIGLAARRWCVAHGIPFTTAFHTRFPDYVALRLPGTLRPAWAYERWFHAPAERVLVATQVLATELAERGIGPTACWSRGVDTQLFRPDGPRLDAMATLPRPIMLSVGRVAAEKQLDAFLAAEVPGSKVVVGDGPDRAALERRFPSAHFLGKLTGDSLASAYRAADLFVFPGQTDTFGLVLIEALACGLPVAALSSPTTAEIVGDAGVVGEDMAHAIAAALPILRQRVTGRAAGYSWSAATDAFLAALAPVGGARRALESVAARA